MLISDVTNTVMRSKCGIWFANFHLPPSSPPRKKVTDSLGSFWTLPSFHSQYLVGIFSNIQFTSFNIANPVNLGDIISQCSLRQINEYKTVFLSFL
jgi:hypothetical protein